LLVGLTENKSHLKKEILANIIQSENESGFGFGATRNLVCVSEEEEVKRKSQFVTYLR